MSTPELIPCSRCDTTIPSTLLIDGMCNRCRVILDEQLRQNRVVEETERAAKETHVERVSAPPVAPPQEELPVVTESKISKAELKEEAQKELARRELARRRYLPFVKRFNKDYDAGWAHADIAARLEQFIKDVEDKKSPRLILNCPPRFGKSELTSRNLAPWALGKHPEWEFILCSYSGSLANRFSRANRAVMRDPQYQILFPDSQLDPDTQSVELWQTTEGGGLLAAGVGGPITGSGAHILLIDDPVKNREEAESPQMRQSVWDWYTSTAYTRLAPGGGVLIIMTRWSDDDLGGRIIREMEEGEGDQFEVVKYRAIATHDEKFRKSGEALHPARYDEEALGRIRKVIGERDWSALYQQEPVPDEGAYFTRDNFHFYMEDERPPDNEMIYYDAWDLAIGTQDHNDWTVGITAGLDTNEDLWVVDRERGKYDGMEIVEKIIDQHLKWDTQITGVEKGQIEMSIMPFLQRRIDERKAYRMNIEGLRTGRRDKMARARAIQGMARAGRIHLPHPSWCPWVEDFVFELLRFPAGQFDDQVDAIAWLGLLITEMSAVQIPRAKKKSSWKDQLDQFVTSGRKKKGFMSA